MLRRGRRISSRPILFKVKFVCGIRVYNTYPFEETTKKKLSLLSLRARGVSVKILFPFVVLLNEHVGIYRVFNQEIIIVYDALMFVFNNAENQRSVVFVMQFG